MREGLFDHHRVDSVTITVQNVGGLVQGEKILGPVPEGYAWYVENLAHVVKGNNRSAVVWWVVTVDDGALGGPAGLVNFDGQGQAAAVGGLAGNYFCAAPIYVGPGHVLHALASAAQGSSVQAGDQVTATAQIAVHQLDPQWMMSPEDRRQVLESHQRRGAELAQVAVAERRAV